MKIGFIGLGIMGAPMAGHLLAASHELFVNTHGVPPKAITDAGAKVCTTGSAVAKNSDIIIIMVPDTPDVEKVLFGKDGVASGLPGQDRGGHGSISPIATRICSAGERTGAEYSMLPFPAVSGAKAPLRSW
jgi:2-hydroxy-3-oxopropionate reductase